MAERKREGRRVVVAERRDERCSNREGREDNSWINMFGIVKNKRNIVSRMLGR